MNANSYPATHVTLRPTNLDGLASAVQPLMRELRTLTEWTVRTRPQWGEVRTWLEDHMIGQDELTFYFGFDRPGIAYGLDREVLAPYAEHPYRMTVRLHDDQPQLTMQKLTRDELG